MFNVKNLFYAINDKKILSNINFNVEKGTWTSIIGPNGAGKTTLLNCLIGDKVYEGEITYIDKNIKEISEKQFFNNVAVLFQDNDISKNITVKSLIKMSFYSFDNLLDINQKNKMYDDVLILLALSNFQHQKLSDLSGGELQRVKLACCLVKQPDVLILDEIFNHLDPKVQDEIEQILISLNKNGLTIISISHNLNIVLRNSHQILALKNGEQFFYGSKNEIVNNGLIDQLFDKEFIKSTINDNTYLI